MDTLKRRLLDVFTVISILIFVAATALWLWTRWHDVDLLVLRRSEGSADGVTVTVLVVACRDGFVPVARRSINGRIVNNVPATQPDGALLALPFWPLFVFTWVKPFFWWSALRDRRRNRWLERGQCTTCGYDLRASTELCPECGSLIVCLTLTSPQPHPPSLSIRARHRPVLRLALKISAMMFAFMVAVLGITLVGEYFRPSAPGEGLTLSHVAVMLVVIPAALGLLMYVGGNWRRRWIVGDAGVDLYRPGQSPCHVPWRNIGDVYCDRTRITLVNREGKHIDALDHLGSEDIAGFMRLWEEHRSVNEALN